jgi:UDP-3-O-[3-hydroxymyristoyl] glucosamine N-acyltransferase
MAIDSRLIKEVLGKELEASLEFSCLGLSNTVHPGSLSFIDDKKYVDQVFGNDHIKGVLITKELASSIKTDKILIESEDPRWDYYTLYNFISHRDYKKQETEIAASAKVHKTASVSDFNVTIGENSVIGPNVTILPDVTIGSNCVVQPGAVIGSEGFEYKRTSKGVLPVFHDGKVIIEDNVEIGANTCVDKGFSFRHTIIQKNVKIDNLVHVAHGVQIGENSFIIACSMLAGSVTIGKNVWVSPNANIAPGLTVEDNAFVSLGAVVTKNVPAGQQVTGNLALPHEKFLKIFKANLQSLEQ